MERRNFLSLCCLPLLSLEKLVPKRQFIHPTFRKFTGITIEQSFEYTTELGSLSRYPYFPIETLFIITYERGIETFVTFNISQELLLQIAQNPLKFVRHKRQSNKWGCDEITLKTIEKISGINKVINQKFVLSSWSLL